VETVTIPPLELIVWDVSGQDRLRAFWRHYYHGTSGIIFVIDSNDSDRFNLAKTELHGILQEEELNDAVILILANKVDLPNSATVEQLKAALELNKLTEAGRIYHIQPTQANIGKGVKEGATWLANAMKNKNKATKQPNSNNTVNNNIANNNPSNNNESNEKKV
jgi:small GTP-binding protein